MITLYDVRADAYGVMTAATKKGDSHCDSHTVSHFAVQFVCSFSLII